MSIQVTGPVSTSTRMKPASSSTLRMRLGVKPVRWPIAGMPAAIAQAREVAARGDAARQAFLPGLAVLSARHESQYSRLFRS